MGFADRKISFAAAIPWTVKGTLAIVDQGLFAGAHFLLNILLARWLPPAEYGAFAVAYSIFLLLAAFHTAGFVEPMAVFGSGRYKSSFKRYFTLLMKGHALVSLPLGLIFGCAAVLVGYWSSALVARSLYALIFAGAALLFLWMARRAFYVNLRPGWPAMAGGFYLALLLCAIWGLRLRGWLSPWSALTAMGACAVLVSSILVLRLDRQWGGSEGTLGGREVLKDHWNYGRWSVAAAAVAWFPANVYFILLPAWGGLRSAAALRALVNLVNPPIHAVVALGALVVPLLVRQREEGGKRAMTRVMLISLCLFLLGAALYLAVLWFFREDAFRLLYAGRYEEYSSWPLFLLGLCPLSLCVTSVLGAGLMALERPVGNFWAAVVAASVAAVAGIPLTAVFGVGGAVLGMLLANLSAGVAVYVFYRRTEWAGTHPVGGKLLVPLESLSTGANPAVVWKD